MNPFDRRNLQFADYLLIFGYFGLNILIGWWCGRKRDTEGSYFLGRKIPWWALGISFYASATSSISDMALPAKTFADNWLVIGTLPAQFAATLVIAFAFVKLLRRLDVATIFEYLDRRFVRTVRMLGAFLGFPVGELDRLIQLESLPPGARASPKVATGSAGILPASFHPHLFCNFRRCAHQAKAFSFGLCGPMKKHLKSQMADFRSSRMIGGAAASNENALPTRHPVGKIFFCLKFMNSRMTYSSPGV